MQSLAAHSLSRRAKIQQHGAAVVAQVDVFRFDIPVDKAGSMDGFQQVLIVGSVAVCPSGHQR